MDVAFKSGIKLDNLLSDAQREWVERFCRWLRDKHYRRESVPGYVRAAKRVLWWANCAGLGIEDLNSEGITRYAGTLKARGRLRKCNGKYTEALRGARRFAAFLSEAGIIPAAPAERPTLLNEFNDWMRSHRGISESTVDRYRPVIKCLLKTLGEEAECYDAKKLRDFVLNLTRQYSPTSTKHVTTPVRMFLRFLIATKRCRGGLEACIPTVPATLRLPNYLSVDAIERIIAACDDTTQIGARDRAIVLLLARLGLRASDVAGLKFSDVNWEQGTITVLGKTRREARLPLPSDVGNALLRYITCWRPKDQQRGDLSRNKGSVCCDRELCCEPSCWAGNRASGRRLAIAWCSHFSALCRNRDASSRCVSPGNWSHLTAHVNSGDRTLCAGGC